MGDSLDPTARIRAAMTRRERTGFLLADHHSAAAENRPLPIGHGQTNSQPTTVARMLELLDVRTGCRVLDVGSGSGWTTAILGDLVGPEGAVFGVERIAQLVDRSRLALAQQLWDDRPMSWATIEPAHPQTLGLPEHAPFDRILVSAEATRVPTALIEQLTPDGILVVPVLGEMLRIIRTGARPEDHSITRHGRFRFVPLVGH